MYCKNCGNVLDSDQAVCLKCGFKVGNGNGFCYNCGKEVNPDAEVCLNCGSKIHAVNSVAKKTVYEKLADYEKTSSTVWLIIGILQIVTFVGIICGIWNIYQSMKTKKNAENIRKNQPSGLYKVYEGNMTNLLVFGVLNLFLGGVIGVLGVAYDFYIRNFVITNKEIFE